MEEWVVKNILIKAKKSLEKLSESLCLFKEFLNRGDTQDLSKYYLARNCLREGQKFREETVVDAKKFLGPQPVYASVDVAAARMRLLQGAKIVALSQNYDGLAVELLEDEFLKSFMSSEEVKGYLTVNQKSQQSGKRKLPNIKVRIVIDKLKKVELEALAWQRRAVEKVQKKA
jgi:hypothetical protein